MFVTKLAGKEQQRTPIFRQQVLINLLVILEYLECVDSLHLAVTGFFDYDKEFSVRLKWH
jgi:hypothetical protein